MAITNAGTGTLADLAVSFPTGSPTWLSASLDRATAPATLTLVASAGSLPPAHYSTTLVISAARAPSLTVTVGLTVEPSATPAYWVSPQNLRLVPGETRRMEVWRIDFSAKQYSRHDSTAWVVADSKVATVSALGVVTAVGPGTTELSSPYGKTMVTVREYTGLQFKQVVSSAGRICALTVEGAVYCWGRVGVGGLTGLDGDGGKQLDLGSSSFEKTEIPFLAVGGPGGHLTSLVSQFVASPELIPAPAFASIGAGDRETCGVTSAGQLSCWGVSYILGGETVATPRLVSLPFAVASAAPPCLLSTAGAVWCYAATSVPFGSFAQATASVRQMTSPSSWLSLGGSDAIARATCGIAADGTGYCWGFQCLGNLGIGPDGTAANSCKAVSDPKLLSTSLSFSALVNSCGLSSGALYCTGPTPDTSLSPVVSTMTLVAGTPSFASLASGTGRCGITPAGANYCWGGGVLPLNSGALTTAATPVRAEPAAPLASVTSGAAANGVSCGVGTDQLLYCWGDGFVGNGLPPGVVGGSAGVPLKVRVVRIGGPAPGLAVLR